MYTQIIAWCKSIGQLISHPKIIFRYRQLRVYGVKPQVIQLFKILFFFIFNKSEKSFVFTLGLTMLYVHILSSNYHVHHASQRLEPLFPSELP